MKEIVFFLIFHPALGEFFGTKRPDIFAGKAGISIATLPSVPSPERPVLEPAAVVVVLTSEPKMFRDIVEKSKPAYYWARAWAVDRITKRSPKFSNKAGEIPLRFHFYDYTDLEDLNGFHLLNRVVQILESNAARPNYQVVGIIIEVIPSPDAPWAQMVFDTAKSLRLPVLAADVRGPSLPLLSNTQTSKCDKSIGLLLSAMPSQKELDAGIVDLVFTVIDKSKFAIVLIDHADEDEIAPFCSSIERLLNEAVRRGQEARLFRIYGHRLPSDAEWKSQVKRVSVQHRKFVIFSHRPELERKFINIAMTLGLAGRDYAFLTLNFDFHLEPLDVQCAIGDLTTVSSIRLRRIDTNRLASVKINEVFDGLIDQPIRDLAVKVSIDAFNRALNNKDEIEDSDENRECSNKYQANFIARTLESEKTAWVMELLNMTNDGYFVKSQYLFPTGKISWILQPSLFFTLSAKSRRRRHVRKAVPLMPCRYNRRLRVTTIVEPPFIMHKRAFGDGIKTAKMLGMSGTRPAVYGSKLMLSRKKSKHLNYTWLHSHTGIEGYEGFCIDLMERLSVELGFSYELSVVPDEKYGTLTKDGKWNGLIGEVESGRFDIALAPLTVTKSRSQVVDFTQSFMTVGIGMLYYKGDAKRDATNDDILLGMFSFFRPFKAEVWLAAMASLIGYSIIHCLLSCMSLAERRSPPDWESRLHPVKPPALGDGNGKWNWTLSNSFWLAMSAIMQQGCDYFPASRTTRLLFVFWGFASLLLCSCYTANLAAFLTTERMETPLRKPADLLTQNKTKYGALQGGSTYSFFKNSQIDMFREMYSHMEIERSLVDIQREGIQRVIQAKGKYAFFLESTKLQYEVSKDCRLTQIGTLLDSKGYGIATQKGSPLRDMLSSLILKLQNNGTIQELKSKWWDLGSKRAHGKHCPRSDMNPGSASRSASRLSIQVLGGSFIILMGAMLIGTVTCLIEFVVYGVLKAVGPNGCIISRQAVFNVWKGHMERVYKAGLTHTALSVKNSNITK